MTDQPMSFDRLNARLRRNPFNLWLGLELLAMDESGIEVSAAWREEFISNPDRRITHGGILAALIDAAADFAIAARIGRPVPTVDMRVDYHRAAMPGDLRAKASVIELGARFATAQAAIYDKDRMLIASGRGLYFTAAPQS
jgi:uncharacterized protein (TIGR00369 family)